MSSANSSSSLCPAQLVRTEAAALDALAARLDGPMATSFERAVELVMHCCGERGRVGGELGIHGRKNLPDGFSGRTVLPGQVELREHIATHQRAGVGGKMRGDGNTHRLRRMADKGGGITGGGGLL